jgi:hypothetical protein
VARSRGGRVRCNTYAFLRGGNTGGHPRRRGDYCIVHTTQLTVDEGSMDSFYFGAYWGPRLSSPLDAAQRLASFLALLAGIHPSLGSWSELSDHPPGPDRDLVALDPASLTTLLTKDGYAPGYGYHLGLWSGDEETSSRLSLACGASLRPTSNTVNVTFQGERPLALVLDSDGARSLVLAAVEVWEPDWATLGTAEWGMAQRKAPKEPVAGWITYLAGSRPKLKPPSGVKSEEIPGKGIVLIAGPKIDEVPLDRVRALGAAIA